MKVAVDGVNLRSKNPMWWEAVCIQSVYTECVYKSCIQTFHKQLIYMDLWEVEASTGIEPVYADLQSAVFH